MPQDEENNAGLCPIFVYTFRTGSNAPVHPLSKLDVVSLDVFAKSGMAGTHAAVSNQLRKSSLTPSQPSLTLRVSFGWVGARGAPTYPQRALITRRLSRRSPAGAKADQYAAL
jgi:hypothetical protein